MCVCIIYFKKTSATQVSTRVDIEHMHSGSPGRYILQSAHLLCCVLCVLLIACCMLFYHCLAGQHMRGNVIVLGRQATCGPGFAINNGRHICELQRWLQMIKVVLIYLLIGFELVP